MIATKINALRRAAKGLSGQRPLLLKLIPTLILSFAPCSHLYASPATLDQGIPAQVETMLRSRPAGSPLIGISGNTHVLEAIQKKGTAKVIVRLAAPPSLPGGFALEADLTHAAASRQRSIINRLQETVLSRVAAKRSATAKRYEFIPFMALEVDNTDLQTLVASPEIDFIEEDIVVPPLLGQSVPLIGGVNGAFAGFTGNGQTVAILDTGVEKTHPFLSGKVVAEGCYSTTSTGTSTAYCTSGSTASGSGLPCSDAATGCYHGTHVAGIAAGNNGPSGAPSGVAKDAKLIAVQVFSQFYGSSYCGSNTTCPQAYNSDLISGLQYIYNLRNSYNISSVNLSLGGGQYATNCDTSFPSFKTAVDNLRRSGIATVIASGNNGYTNSISFPACISSSISVGATDKSDAVTYYSNSATFLNLLAPGDSIYSSLLNGTYGYLSGTSMATPHVSGAWAVLKSVQPTATVDDVLNALTSSGKSITDGRNGIVKPRIQLDLAVYRLEGLLPVDGVCGVANGQTFDTAPSANLCSTGTPSQISGSGPWTWSCAGLYGGGSASCSAAVTTFTIAVSVTNSAGGAISASASTAPYGGSVTFSITPYSGFTLAALVDNGQNVSATANADGTFSYAISNVTSNHTVTASFAALPAEAVPAIPPFGVSAGILLAILGYTGLSRTRGNQKPE